MSKIVFEDWASFPHSHQISPSLCHRIVITFILHRLRRHWCHKLGRSLSPSGVHRLELGKLARPRILGLACLGIEPPPPPPPLLVRNYLWKLGAALLVDLWREDPYLMA